MNKMLWKLMVAFGKGRNFERPSFRPNKVEESSVVSAKTCPWWKLKAKIVSIQIWPWICCWTSHGNGRLKVSWKSLFTPGSRLRGLRAPNFGSSRKETFVPVVRKGQNVPTKPDACTWLPAGAIRFPAPKTEIPTFDDSEARIPLGVGVIGKDCGDRSAADAAGFGQKPGRFVPAGMAEAGTNSWIRGSGHLVQRRSFGSSQAILPA